MLQYRNAHTVFELHFDVVFATESTTTDTQRRGSAPGADLIQEICRSHNVERLGEAKKVSMCICLCLARSLASSRPRMKQSSRRGASSNSARRR